MRTINDGDPPSSHSDEKEPLSFARESKGGFSKRRPLVDTKEG